MSDPQAGDESYNGFRISEMWAVTAVDPDDNQEGVCAVWSPDQGHVPLVGSDRNRLTSLLEPMAAQLREANPTVTVKRFVLADGAGQLQADLPETVQAAELHSDPDWRAYVTHVETELIPKIEDAGMTISLVPKGKTDVKFAIELGLSIMYGKPILAVVPKGAEVPEKLKLVADEIVEIDFEDTEKSGPALKRAMDRMAKRLGLA